jgi:putative heme iron utilization protein
MTQRNLTRRNAIIEAFAAEPHQMLDVIAKQFGVSRAWICKVLADARAEGDARAKRRPSSPFP